MALFSHHEGIKSPDGLIVVCLQVLTLIKFMGAVAEVTAGGRDPGRALSGQAPWLFVTPAGGLYMYDDLETVKAPAWLGRRDERGRSDG